MPHTDRIKEESQKDNKQSLLKQIIFRGWPENRKNCPCELHKYWNYRCDLVLTDGFIIKVNRIVIPTSLRDKVLKAIHTAHQGEIRYLMQGNLN